MKMPRTGKRKAGNAKRYPYLALRPSAPIEKRIRKVAKALTKKLREAGRYDRVTVSEVMLKLLSRGLPLMEAEAGIVAVKEAA